MSRKFNERGLKEEMGGGEFKLQLCREKKYRTDGKQRKKRY